MKSNFSISLILGKFFIVRFGWINKIIRNWDSPIGIRKNGTQLYVVLTSNKICLLSVLWDVTYYVRRALAFGIQNLFDC